jgi:hypothetical protein
MHWHGSKRRKFFHLIERKRDMFFVLLEQTPSERQRVQRTLEQLVYESLEN